MKYLDNVEKLKNKLHKDMSLSASDIMFVFLGIMEDANKMQYSEPYLLGNKVYEISIKRARAKNNLRFILSEFERFKKAFNFDFHRTRTDVKKVWLWRVFILAMTSKDIAVNNISRAVGKDHTTLAYHLKKATEYDKFIAERFANDKNYKYNEDEEEINFKKRNLWYGRKK